MQLAKRFAKTGLTDFLNGAPPSAFPFANRTAPFSPGRMPRFSSQDFQARECCRASDSSAAAPTHLLPARERAGGAEPHASSERSRAKREYLLFARAVPEAAGTRR